MADRFKNYITIHDMVSFNPHIADNIRDFFASGPQPGKPLRIRVAATHSGKITCNNTFYLPHKMRDSVKTWTSQYPKPVLINHDSHGEPVGRVIAARYVDISNRIQDAWDVRKLSDSTRPISNTLLDAFCQGKLTDRETVDIAREYFIQDASISDDPDYEGLGYIELVCDIADPAAIQKILDKRYLTGSTGSSTNQAICSVCKTDWADEGRCEHMPGKLYDDKKCILIAGDFHYNEWSFVNKPADRHSKVLEVNLGGMQDSVTMEDAVDGSGQIPQVLFELSDAVVKAVHVKTEDAEGHHHTAFVDEDGDGDTSFNSGHAHEVQNWLVLDAVAADGKGEYAKEPHVHKLRNPLRTVRDQEEEKMTFEQALKLASEHEQCKDAQGLEDIVKNVLEEHKDEQMEDNYLLELILKAIEGTLSQSNNEPADPQDQNNEDTVKSFFGEHYDEIVGDDEFGVKYAQMWYDALNDPELGIQDAKLSAEARKKLPASVFCGPDRSYPVNDCAHAKAAMAYAKKYNESASVIACIRRKAKRLGCPFESTKDSVDVGEFTVEYFDRFTDDQLLQLQVGLEAVLEDRAIECPTCSDNTNTSELEARIKDQQTELQRLQQDNMSLQDALVNAQSSVRENKVKKIADLKYLSGEQVDLATLTDELKEKSSDEVDEILKDLGAKVDIVQIADRLNSGLARNPEGTVSDPTLKLEDGKPVQGKKWTREDLEAIRDQYVSIAMHRGQHVAELWLADAKAKGLVPVEMPVADKS
jgi:hypothetical protein